MDKLRKNFIELCNHPLASVLWGSLAKEYSGPKRHYHNLNHLANMFEQLEQCRHLISDWDSVLFALYYHDYIYKSTAKDNEEQSADQAKSQLSRINYDPSKIASIVELILATKHHNVSPNNDINLFTDADLSILGSSPDKYEEYTQQVRKEYSIYPDLVYKPGRKKVLSHFLEMPAIFKTPFFRDRFETAARENLKRELSQL